MNSHLAWFWMFGEASPLRGGKWRKELREQYIAQIPLPGCSESDRDRLSELSNICTAAAARRLDLQATVAHRFLDLATPAGPRKLTRKLENWWALDLATFRAEVKRTFKTEIPLRERAEWEAYLAENAAEVRSLTTQIEDAEREIDAIVYRLFDLTDDEVKLLEASLEGQY